VLGGIIYALKYFHLDLDNPKNQENRGSDNKRNSVENNKPRHLAGFII
jgi:hypothetical protein